MRILGELCLLSAFVSSGFAAFACAAGARREQRVLRAAGILAAVATQLALTMLAAVLVWALLRRDFSFAYVAEYTSATLPWYYSVSALWVGQAGSLLVWAWMSGALALVYGLWPRRQASPLRGPAFGVLMACVCFLLAIMVFAADPMEASLAQKQDGAGLSPSLQHPAMLIHPPIVFLGYALWGVPFALAAVALVTGRLDTDWVRQSRPWAVAAWAVLGGGILWGAEWAYESLGWGGYWGWDPVENGSFIPWLTGTALVHTLMAWQYHGALKKTALALAIATFGLCNFATFLTRSGIFSSLHAFSKSPIGWLFLALMTVLVAGGGVLLVLRRQRLAPEKPIRSVFSREAFVAIASVALLLLTGVVVAGTVSTALSNLIAGQMVMVGPPFYNNVLIPTGLLLLTTTGMAPLLSWGADPTPAQIRWLLASAVASGLSAATAWLLGCRQWIELSVAGLAGLSIVALFGAVLLDARRREPHQPWWGVFRTLRESRRQYAGFLIHLGLVCLAVGVTGSSVGTHQEEFVLQAGETIQWAGRDVRLARINQRELPDKLVAEAELEISRGGHVEGTVRPAQHYYRVQRQWASVVAIHSTWDGDFYTILHAGEGPGKVRATFVANPLMRFLWLGGSIMGLGAVIRLWPTRRRSAHLSVVPLPEDQEQEASPARPAAAA
jgi:cytochrome c-type biogenesis protein CcmF